MRGKRSKQYRKLMQQYALGFGFREPYQVIVTSDIIEDAARFQMDLTGGISRTLHGEVKPLITQCSIRHMYNATPKNENLILQAKTYERRRCGHLPDEDPKSELECLKSVVDSKENGTNKHRYVVATQDQALRAQMRAIPVVPLIYINRSVMIMEPMADATATIREREERAKFKAGLKPKRGSTITGKRLREDDDEQDHFLGREGNALLQSVLATAPPPTADSPAEAPPAKKKRKAPKEFRSPDMQKSKVKGAAKSVSSSEPLSEEALEKKAKKAKRDEEKWERRMANRAAAAAAAPTPIAAKEEVSASIDGADGVVKRKRKHKSKPKAETGDDPVGADD
ncbi:rRNA-processing protein UTP23 [Venturia nashicola]|uniref:U three protein 23 n=1 Tax=Venturia nashicola TaxID=86259 RepID=A0A4Z1NZ52_9PEZI|nr:rRNA-processing protein UTP23 [Venturia nashicola]